tara:strand:+ start:695 stop:1792 length:1098 start_codon:yes stop_codon:yes gene_type:complete
MLNTKKYIVIDDAEIQDYCEIEEQMYNKIKIKIVDGFTADKTNKVVTVSKGWQPLDNGKDKLFFFPGCSVPRFKVREHFACTIKPSSATAAFISAENLMGSGSTFDCYEDLYPIDLKTVIDMTKTLMDQSKAKVLQSFIANQPIEQVFLTRKLWKEANWNSRFFDDDYTIDSFMRKSEHGMGRWSFKFHQKKAQYRLLGINHKSGLKDLPCEVYLEDEILQVLNKDNFVIDAEKYEELKAFGDTKDKENLVLMMELMANSDFEKSFIYLLFLIKEFQKEIVQLKESSHVNFKSLLSYLGIDHLTDDLDIYKLTILAKKHKKFTRVNAALISGLCQDDYIGYDTKDNQCWTCGPILKKDSKNYLDD